MQQTETLRQYFDEFCEDFKKFDGELIATRFISPLVVVNSEGEVNSYASAVAVAKYFQGYLDDYKSKGVVSCVYKDLELININHCAYLATVSWELLNVSGGVEVSWRESYNLVEVQGKLKAFSTYDH